MLKIGAEEIAQQFKALNALTEVSSSVPKVQAVWLTTVWNSSSSDTACMRYTPYMQANIYMHKINYKKNKKKDVQSRDWSCGTSVKHLFSVTEVLNPTSSA